MTTHAETESTDANWWFFQLSQGPEDALMPAMPFLPTGSAIRPRSDISYYSYLQLEQILSAQTPLTRAPDERAFIVVHQLFELTFKLMLFDMGVLAQTFAEINRAPNEAKTVEATFSARAFLDIEFSGGIDPDKPSTNYARWIPALTAAARLKFSSSTLLPMYFQLISGEKAAAADTRPTLTEPQKHTYTFNSRQFERFRFRLPPASGFQSAQFRVVQRGLGKRELLELPYFDRHLYAHNYHGRPANPNELPEHTMGVVDDPEILRTQTAVARPPDTAPASGALNAQYLAATILERIARLKGLTVTATPAPDLTAEATAVLKPFEENLKIVTGQLTAEWYAQFESHLLVALAKREQVIAQTPAANDAYSWMRNADPANPFLICMQALIDADDALFSSNRSPFLEHHLSAAKKAGLPDDDKGSGGGGVAFLNLSRALNRLFPVLPGLRRN
jgi:tryptophan 2,3-dioxygenase